MWGQSCCCGTAYYYCGSRPQPTPQSQHQQNGKHVGKALLRNCLLGITTPSGWILIFRGTEIACHSVMFCFAISVPRVSRHSRHAFDCTTDIQPTAGRCTSSSLCANDFFLFQRMESAKLDENRRAVGNSEPRLGDKEGSLSRS